MFQFDQQQFLLIKSRASNKIIQAIIDDNKDVLFSDTLVPPDNRATWNHYYYCPDHGVRLIWDRDKPLEHCCPIDNKIFTGEPYDGAWWRWLNGINSKACYQVGLLWKLTEDKTYFNKVRDILLQYANYYPTYEPHGGIPYNGPGKANSQTLCEANCHLDLTLGYDFIRDDLSNEDKEYIENRLLREGADFLILHRTKQIHNHEIKINSTIGVIGIILNDENYIDIALNDKYGLRYQLNTGVKGEGLWFEGSIHYHYYALQALMAYEKIARNTQYSISNNPNYYRMLTFPLKLVLTSGNFPRMNDCVAGQEEINETHIYEFAYSEFRDPIFATALASIYKNVSRDNMDALLYGVEKLPFSDPLTPGNIHAPNVGLTLLSDKKTNNQILLRHSLYGGEHDHYDSLGLMLIKEGKEILPDLGTTGYGSKLHYGYYKTTSSHNTLVVNQKNQTPANPIVLNYMEKENMTFVDTLVDWRLPAAKVDSHTLEHWDENSYRDIQFRRSIIWLGIIAIEINQVNNPHGQQLDLTWHTRGDFISPFEEDMSVFALEGPLERMVNCQISSVRNEIKSFKYDVGLKTPYSQYISCVGGEKWITGYAPDNPATSDLSYVLLRSYKKVLKNIVLHDLEGTWTMRSNQWFDDGVEIELSNNKDKKIILVNFLKGKVDIY